MNKFIKPRHPVTECDFKSDDSDINETEVLPEKKKGGSIQFQALFKNLFVTF